jgi:hypothetical protein
MSTPVTYIGNSYNIPAYQDTGYAQGAGNLSSYLIALATGSLTLAGGNFTLTADANFGATYGLVAAYFTSRAANAATAGAFRLANGDSVAWKNGTNTGNVNLSVNANDQLTYSGDILLPAGNGIVVTTPNGSNTYRIYVDDNGELTTLQLS